jgi:hypothetical protein
LSVFPSKSRSLFPSADLAVTLEAIVQPAAVIAASRTNPLRLKKLLVLFVTEPPRQSADCNHAERCLLDEGCRLPAN